jgi:hypothetical protein
MVWPYHYLQLKTALIANDTTNGPGTLTPIVAILIVFQFPNTLHDDLSDLSMLA